MNSNPPKRVSKTSLTAVGISCIRVVANVMNYLLFGLLILGLVALFGTLVFACVGTIVVWFDEGYR